MACNSCWSGVPPLDGPPPGFMTTGGRRCGGETKRRTPLQAVHAGTHEGSSSRGKGAEGERESVSERERHEEHCGRTDADG